MPCGANNNHALVKIPQRTRVHFEGLCKSTAPRNPQPAPARVSARLSAAARKKFLRLRADSARNMWLGWLAVAHGILKKCVGRHGRITLMTFQPIRNSCVVIIAWRRSACVQDAGTEVQTHGPAEASSFSAGKCCVCPIACFPQDFFACAAAAQEWPADLDASLQHSMPTV